MPKFYSWLKTMTSKGPIFNFWSSRYFDKVFFLVQKLSKSWVKEQEFEYLTFWRKKITYTTWTLKMTKMMSILAWKCWENDRNVCTGHALLVCHDNLGFLLAKWASLSVSDVLSKVKPFYLLNLIQLCLFLASMQCVVL